jgi:hypothetical protein
MRQLIVLYWGNDDGKDEHHGRQTNEQHREI